MQRPRSRAGVVARLLGRLLADRSGALVVKFALSAPILLVLVGGTIDYGAYQRDRQKLQVATDAASKAAALELTLIDYTKVDVQSLVQSMVNATMMANTGYRAGTNPVAVHAQTRTDPLQVMVDAVQPRTSFMGGFGLQQNHVKVRSVAQVIGKPNICVLGLDPSEEGTIELWTLARMTGQNCAVYSNSTSTSGIAVKNNAKLSATMVCSAGGASGGNSSFSQEPITDCPSFADPLASRAAPEVGACTATGLVIANETLTLQPGVYCGGLTIAGGSVITFAPGVFVIKDGPLIVADSASVTGRHVGFYLVGNGALFKFDTPTSLSLSAPETGPMAGLLFFEGRSQPTTVEHEINSDNAKMLLGTIYLPRGTLRIDANKPIAGDSAYTAIVVRKMKLYSGPHLILNTNYEQTSIPVPEGIKGVGQPVAIVQ